MSNNVVRASKLALSLAAMALVLTACGSKEGPGDEVSSQLTKPVASVKMAGEAAAPAAAGGEAAPAPAAAAGPVDGKKIYEATCAACHATGAAGAPKVGDKAAWGPRIAQGVPALINSATNGKNAMPPKGGNASLKDDEIKAVVEYMVAQSK